MVHFAVQMMNYITQVEFIKNRFDEGAGEVVGVILLLNNQIDGDMSQCSSSASYDQVPFTISS